MTATVHAGDCRDVLRTLPEKSVQTVITSPPYFGLRDYSTGEWEGGDPACDHMPRALAADKRKASSGLEGGHAAIREGDLGHGARRVCRCGARRVDRQIGLEKSPDEFAAALVQVFREVRRVLRDDGVVWINLGDSYNAYNGNRGLSATTFDGQRSAKDPTLPSGHGLSVPTLKQKDLIGVPWMVAFALRADGWYLRSDVVWCLSGGARVYARTQKGDMPMMVKDLVRLDPATVKLWNREKWTQALGWSRSPEPRDGALEIELRSGERIGCTPGHLWPTQRGDVRADELEPGDVMQTCRLPEPDVPHAPACIGREFAWIAGLYLAEGSRDSRDRLQFAGHTSQNDERAARIRDVVQAFGGTMAVREDGNTGTIIVDSPALSAILRQYIHGQNAREKGIKVRAWRHDDAWLTALLTGYLDGDGHYDEANDRWRLGFTRNDRLAGDMRTLAARLGCSLTLKATHGEGFGKRWPIYRGELRWTTREHWNSKDRGEVVSIRPSKARQHWDIGVADEPHTFALASGVLTHNSKPNPMPESVTDRPTRSHEFLFLLSKGPRYFYDQDAIREDFQDVPHGNYRDAAPDRNGTAAATGRVDGFTRAPGSARNPAGRNKRSVWTVATQPFSSERLGLGETEHFAVMPTKLIEPCVLAGSAPKACGMCGAPWTRVVERTIGGPNRTSRPVPSVSVNGDGRNGRDSATWGQTIATTTVGWEPSCAHADDGTGRSVVLDPFAGSGTVGVVAGWHGRDFVGIELSPSYAQMARERIALEGRPGGRPASHEPARVNGHPSLFDGMDV